MPRRELLAAVLSLTIAGCGGADVGVPGRVAAPVAYTRDTPLPGSAGRVAFALPRPAAHGFFDAPWPSELRRRGGRPDFAGYPGEDTVLVREYVATAARDVDGFSIAPVVYFRFEAPIDTARLPRGPRETLNAHAAVFLVDVDPSSPERGAFRPLEARVFRDATRFVAANTLAVKPLAGFVLRPGTLYAAVVRRDFGDPHAEPLGTSGDLEAMKNTAPRADAVEEAARALHVGAFDALAELGAPREDVAAIALFRTQVPHATTAKLLDVAAHLGAAQSPRLLRASFWPDAPGRGRAASYTVVHGTYCTPNFQGEIERAPFFESGGELRLDVHGAPVVVPVPEASPYRDAACGGLLRARFVLSVPLAPMPKGGYPLMHVGHGTGGTAMSFLGEDDFAGWAAREGVAVVSTDQPIHGADDPEAARPGSREPAVLRVGGLPVPLGSGRTVSEIGFYNPLRPSAARDNMRQAAVDGFMLLHLVARADLGALLPAGGPVAAPRFDATRLFYGGHSQGSQSAAVLGALDPSARGVVLSGCGGDARIGIARRRDLAIKPLLTMLLGLEPEELDEFHPLLALVQTLADPIDPASYARFYWERAAGRQPASVLHFEGVSDTFNPPEAAEALAVALHAAQVGRVVRDVPGLDLLGGPRGAASATANEPSGATIGFVQLASTRGENGHFVLYYEPAAAEVLRGFLRTALAGDATVRAP